MSQSTQLANAKREKGREHERKRKRERERERKGVLLESQLQRRTRNVRVPFSWSLLFLSSSLFVPRENKNLFNTEFAWVTHGSACKVPWPHAYITSKGAQVLLHESERSSSGAPWVREELKRSSSSAAWFRGHVQIVHERCLDRAQVKRPEAP